VDLDPISEEGMGFLFDSLFKGGPKTMSEYDKLVKRMRRLMEIKDFPSAVKEAGGILEKLLKDLYTELLKEISADKKEKVLKVEKEIGQGKSIKLLTLGQLIGLFINAKLFSDLSDKFKKTLQYFTAENLNRMNELRNKCTHDDFEPAEHEANYVVSLLINIINEFRSTEPSPSVRRKFAYTIILVIFGLTIVLAYYLITSKRVDPLKLEKSIVMIVLKGENGDIFDSKPGFIVNEEGIVVTHPEILRKKEKSREREKKRVDMFVKFYNGAYFNIENMKIDSEADVALLKVDGKDLPSLKIENSDKMRLGDEVVLFGKGDTSEKEVVKGNVLGVNFVKEKNRKIFQIKVPFCSIGEGAPVLNTNGDVVGLITRVEKETTSCTVLPSNYFKDIKIETGGESSEHWYIEGIRARNARDWDTAIKWFKKAVEVDPRNSEAWVELGGIFFEKRKYDEEVWAFKKATEADPKNLDAWHYLGTAYEDKGLYDLAIKAYEKAVNIYPEDVEVRESLALLYILKSDKSSALKQYEILLKLNEGVAKKIKKLAEMIK
jgi:tetratricopeptide (TPR) repeat protein